MHGAKRRLFGRRLRPTGFAVPLAVLASVLVSGTLLAGGSSTVKGKISGWDKLMPQAYSDAAKSDSHRFTWREPSPTVKQDFRKLSASSTHDVCIAAFGGGAAQGHASQRAMVTGGRISPTTIVLAPGSYLKLKNADPFPHALYEVNSASWTANQTAPGSERDWAATAPGLHVIRDQLFPSVVMYVVVDANAVETAFPDRDGNFAINLPNGDYTLKAFFDGKAVGKPVDGVHVGDKDVDLKDALAVGDAK
jgi:hypothetical protein